MNGKDRAYITRLGHECPTKNIVQAVNWPPQSPNINPVENIWDNMNRRERHRVLLTLTVVDLRTSLMVECAADQVVKINPLIAFMPLRGTA